MAKQAVQRARLAGVLLAACVCATASAQDVDACPGLDAASCYAAGWQLLQSPSEQDRGLGVLEVYRACELGSPEACEAAAGIAANAGEVGNAATLRQRAAELRGTATPDGPPPEPAPEPWTQPPLPTPGAQPQPAPQPTPQPQPQPQPAQPPPPSEPNPPTPKATPQLHGPIWAGPTLAGYLALSSDGNGVGYGGLGFRLGGRIGMRTGKASTPGLSVVPALGLTFGLEQVNFELGLTLTGRVELVALTDPKSLFPAFNIYGLMGAVGVSQPGGLSAAGFRLGLGGGWNLFTALGERDAERRMCGLGLLGCTGSGYDILGAALLLVVAAPQLEVYWEVLDLGTVQLSGLRFSIGIGF